MAKFLVFSHPLLTHGLFLDRRIRVGRRPGFFFYIWLRHDHRGSQGPKGEISNGECHRENPDDEGVGGSPLSGIEEGGGGKVRGRIGGSEGPAGRRGMGDLPFYCVPVQDRTEPTKRSTRQILPNIQFTRTLDLTEVSSSSSDLNTRGPSLLKPLLADQFPYTVVLVPRNVTQRLIRHLLRSIFMQR